MLIPPPEVGLATYSCPPAPPSNSAGALQPCFYIHTYTYKYRLSLEFSNINTSTYKHRNIHIQIRITFLSIYIHTYLHTYLYTYIQTYMQTVPILTHTYIPPSLPAGRSSPSPPAAGRRAA